MDEKQKRSRIGKRSPAPCAYRVEPAGDRAMMISLDQAELAGAPLQDRLAAAARWLEEARWSWLLDAVPAYDTLLAVYDPVRLMKSMKPGAEYPGTGLLLPYELAGEMMRQRLEAQPSRVDQEEAAVVRIPVRYGGAAGPDLEEAAFRSGLGAEEFIRLHSAPLYRVVMIGFLPGFAYLDGLPPELSQPRRSSPRPLVPAGSVGIGGGQTGVYPSASPGGWRLIGRTDAELADFGRERPSLLQAGDHVRFVPE
ncbi:MULTISPECIES: 5-oxoprolinase subunit PxpB [unclassified Paenibacillus]|uniref:5-oxoprolinase subunit PxpB n=1 Tax=unclassified Paenibacillus TaxID=185978 RepID=UPI0012FD1A65|nr:MULTISPECIES: 5-oxoprolinase subunit PxpB [unclassified Paenibacillus]ASS68916.2 5-oxoprolinase subunit PxpB [Paenibacillus sp. RUD330]